MMGSRCTLSVVLVLTIVIAGCGGSADIGVSGDDLVAMKRAARAYSEAWLTNDPEAVMATFVADPVLSPSGMQYIEGQAGAREFWWPVGSSAAIVNRFEYEELEAAGSGDIGFVRGIYTLGFEYDGQAITSVGKFLHLMKRDPEGKWQISHHFWNDLPVAEGE
jgi:ketosteroid isomerase-like protein